MLRQPATIHARANRRSPQISLLLAAGGVLLGGLSACSSSSSPAAPVALGTLTGLVREAGGAGLAGVTVTAEGGASAVTDAGGVFILVDLLPTGPTDIEFDGTTASVPGKLFPILDMLVDLQPGFGNIVPNPVTLPDLNNVASANQTVAVDGAGTTTEAIAATGGQPNIRLAAAIGTTITVGGAVPVGSVNLNATPVPPKEVPMPLPGSTLLASSFLTIQPGNGTFSPALDVTMPNNLDFPVDTVVDIWSFDHAAGTWVNRSAETGNTGIVVDLGGGNTEIQANGVITKGGWHSPVINIVANCATIVTGHVMNNETSAPIAGASVALSTGQFTTTNAAGDFTFPVVPAYDATAAGSGTCTAIDLDYEIVLPPSLGQVDFSGTIAAGAVVPGGTTVIPDYAFDLPMTGSIAGLVTGVGATPAEKVVIDTVPPSDPMEILPNENGAFFLSNLAVGDYTASFHHEGQISATVVNFSVVLNTVVTVNIQHVSGVGIEDITVLVYLDRTTLAEGAKVTLVGTDAGTESGIVGLTDANGEVTFEDVTGPYTVTAQMDVLEGKDTVRVASTVIGVNPPQDTIGMLINDDDEAPQVMFTDATISGVVSNFTMNPGDELFVKIWISGPGGMDMFQIQTFVDPFDGSYEADVPSGFTFETAVVMMAPNNQSTESALMLGSSIGPVGSGLTLTQDFDFSVGVVDFDQALDVSFTNPIASVDFHDIFIEFRQNDEPVAEFSIIESFQGALTNPVSVMIPDLTDAGLAGYDVFIGSEMESFPKGMPGVDVQCMFEITSNAATLDFTFPEPPSNPTPAMDAEVDYAVFAQSTLSFTLGAGGPAGASGFNFLTIDDEFQPGVVEGIDAMGWRIWAPSDTSSVALPPTVLPMFGEGGQYYFVIEQIRLAGPSINYNNFFDANVVSNLDAAIAAITQECSSEYEIMFSTSEPVLK